MADWEKHSIDDLREYGALKESLGTLPEEIRALEEDMQLVKGTRYDKTPVEGGASGYEERLINYIDRKGRLEQNLGLAQARVERIERGLSVLTDNERLVLTRFYIHREPRYLDRLCGELGYEMRNIYKIKDAALRKFTLAMYGVRDI